MSEIVLGDPLASELEMEAQVRGMEVEGLIEDILRQIRFKAQTDKIDAESLWWYDLPLKDRARYSGEFVAVHNREVVDHDIDEDALLNRIRAQYGKTAVLVTPADRIREYRIVSTRLSPR